MRGRAYHVVMPTFAAEEWEAFRPGMLMFDAMFEELGPQTGFDGCFDFTIEDEPYKARFGATARPMLEYMSPKSPLGALAYVYWKVKASRCHPAADQAGTAAGQGASEQGDPRAGCLCLTLCLRPLRHALRCPRLRICPSGLAAMASR